ncbi:DNA-3-methyladenine glycosylase I [Salinispira pacifica]|uniref:DNA-3-methyladenine glycosylase n=1 Tax=Salinispira pacifica TaxID=1307761 RepID=V5WHL3_9SPIO|nr:DNA-3-methyladenine glycosylase I [Salinispira pacifica]AHC14661.1 DNA-3-methyladenine glycosylase [Salinispira pacifica]
MNPSILKGSPDPNRCPWCAGSEIYENYHDTVWGVPNFDDRELFAKLCLDGQQAGLSWLTILKKMQNYYRAYDNFNPEKIINYGEKDFTRLLSNPGIIRNKLKIRSIIANSKAFVKMEDDGESLSDFLWGRINYSPIQNHFSVIREIPTETPLSREISKDLKKRGFSFVGPTIVYAFMQAVGMVNDHLTTCFRHSECRNLAEKAAGRSR